MSSLDKLLRVAPTDFTFSLQNGLWSGKCLICNGPVAFEVRTGEGATLEHIRARLRGGTDDLQNLAIVHATCNWEKGRRWDPKRKRTTTDYEAFVERMLSRRLERWRNS